MENRLKKMVWVLQNHIVETQNGIFPFRIEILLKVTFRAIIGCHYKIATPSTKRFNFALKIGKELIFDAIDA